MSCHVFTEGSVKYIMCENIHRFHYHLDVVDTLFIGETMKTMQHLNKNEFRYLCLIRYQNGVCGCEKGFTEVITAHGYLDYCTRTQGTDKKADVKSNGGRLKSSRMQKQNESRDWTLQPLGPGGGNAFTIVFSFTILPRLLSALTHKPEL